MGKKIVILGDLSEADLERIDAIAQQHGYEVAVAGNDGDAAGSEGAALPAAYLSFLPCTPATVIEQFGTLPIGAGETIPFFQRVEHTVPPFTRELPIAGFFEVPLTKTVIISIFRSIERNEALLTSQRELSQKVVAARSENERLVEIGTALTNETDLRRLLHLILTICRKAVHADAGSVYVRERQGSGGPFLDSLLFMVAQNDSIDTERGSQHQLPISRESIAGYVADTGKPLNIDDIAMLEEGVPYRPNTKFQNYFGYRSKSMLTVPLKNINHEVVGVLQLINHKDDPSRLLSDGSKIDEYVTPFNLHDESFVLSVASLAAVSIERAQLHESITALFEGFLNSAVASIDERDRVTSGHSRRVMGYAMAFVDAVEKYPKHPFHVLCETPERRRQFKFAAQLHDIGKIGVPEYVLNKERKLSRDTFEQLIARIDYISLRMVLAPESVSWKSSEELEEDRELIIRVNNYGKIDSSDIAKLRELAAKTYTDSNGRSIPLLSAYDLEALSITRGNLTSAERDLINSHARSSFRILSQIPWTSGLDDVPKIAAQHHEKIDGSGYPDGLTGEEMFLESKILAVIDIYEALVAQDRSYKPKMAPETALEILRHEVAQNHLDRTVVEFFINEGIYNLYVRPELVLQ
ncbi:MAG: GAF domain-containing protein [Chitinispirillaceae bacterium]|nr:GAF domain-containing protein [Chitinispirillaceae bacterium]